MIGECSPECQLQPGEPLDIPFGAPDDYMSSIEDQVKVTAAQHEQEEITAQSDQKTDFRYVWVVMTLRLVGIVKFR